MYRYRTVVVSSLAAASLVLALIGCHRAAPAGGLTEAPPVVLRQVVDSMTRLRLECEVNGKTRRMVESEDRFILGACQDILASSHPCPPPTAKDRDWLAITFEVGDAGEKTTLVRCDYVVNSMRISDPAFIRLPDGWYCVPGSLGSLLWALDEYDSYSGEVDAGDRAFLDRFGWTPAFCINSFHLALPGELKHRPGEFPTVLYWAYNNELNEDIGLDLRPFLGQAVEVRIYKVIQPLPDFMAPRREAGRAVVVRRDSEIVGAWLDVGRHDAFACSLRGRRLEDITDGSWDDWVAAVIDERDPVEQRLAALTPEEMIKQYYAAIDRDDLKAAHACESRSALRRALFANMDNYHLYNPGYRDSDGDGIGVIESARVLSIRRREDLEEGREGKVREYEVRLDLQVRRSMTYDSGVQTRFINLRRETLNTGWRIEGCGTGP